MGSDSPNILTDFEGARTAQAQWERERERARLLLEVNNAIVSHLSIPELFKAVTVCLRRVIRHDFAAMTFYDPEKNVLRPQALDFPKREGAIEVGVPINEIKPSMEQSWPTPQGNLTLEANEREHILRALRETGWVVGGPDGAATRLGINRSTLQSRMRKLGITRPK